jgi:hypothetical protein
MILATADEDDVGSGESASIVCVDRPDLDLEAAPPRPLGEGRDIPAIAIEVEEVRKQVSDHEQRC